MIFLVVRIVGVLVGWCFVFFFIVIVILILVVVIYLFVEDLKLFFWIVGIFRLVNVFVMLDGVCV